MDFEPFLSIVGPTYTLASLNADCQRCVNMIVEKIETGTGRNESYLKETPGLLTYWDAATFTPPGADLQSLAGQPIQAMHVCGNGRVFIIVAERLLELTEGPVATYIVNLRNASGIPSPLFNYQMADNALMLVVVTDNAGGRGGLGDGYGLASYTFADGTTRNLDFNTPGFLGTKFIAFLDQYFITVVTDNATGKLTHQCQISPVNVANTTSWSAKDVFGVESNPDPINGLIVNGREVWIFGANSYEVFHNTGDATLPFQRISGAAYAVGLLAPYSLQSFKGNVFWLGSSKEGFGIVWMSQGLQAVRISTTAIERLIQSEDTIADATSWSYQIPGHQVYVLNFPTAKKTYAYDLISDLWHELAYRNPTTQIVTRHRAANQILAFGKNLVGDFENGKIYEYSLTTYTDDTAPIIRYRRAPCLTKGRRLIFFHKFELDIQMGVGLVDGNTPRISVRWSNDNGHTWSNYHTRSIGKIGEYRKSIIFSNQGCSKVRVYEVYINDPVPFRIISAEIGITIGEH